MDSDPVAALHRMVDTVARKRQDVNTFLDDPIWVSWMMLLDTISMFETWSGRTPTRIHLPKSVEMLIDAYAAKHLDQAKSLRDSRQLLGLQVVLDAHRFLLE